MSLMFRALEVSISVRNLLASDRQLRMAALLFSSSGMTTPADDELFGLAVEEGDVMCVLILHSHDDRSRAGRNAYH